MQHNTSGCNSFDVHVLPDHHLQQDNCNLYYLLDYVPDGDLFTYMQKVHCLDEEHTKFYTSQLAL